MNTCHLVLYERNPNEGLCPYEVASLSKLLTGPLYPVSFDLPEQDRSLYGFMSREMKNALDGKWDGLVLRLDAHLDGNSRLKTGPFDEFAYWEKGRSFSILLFRADMLPAYRTRAVCIRSGSDVLCAGTLVVPMKTTDGAIRKAVQSLDPEDLEFQLENLCRDRGWRYHPAEPDLCISMDPKNDGQKGEK